MPFKSKAQMKYLWANHPEVAAEFAKETKDTDSLPERVSSREKTAALFAKIAKKMFLSDVNPPLPQIEIQKSEIEASKSAKRGGRSPVEYRNELTRQRTGIVQKNSNSQKRTN